MQVRWTKPALENIDEIQNFIAQDNPHAAHRLINRLIDRIETLLAKHPTIGRPGRVDGTRELVITRTSYIAAYRIRSDVEILAVVHAAREWPRELHGKGSE